MPSISCRQIVMSTCSSTYSAATKTGQLECDMKLSRPRGDRTQCHSAVAQPLLLGPEIAANVGKTVWLLCIFCQMTNRAFSADPSNRLEHPTSCSSQYSAMQPHLMTRLSSMSGTFRHSPPGQLSILALSEPVVCCRNKTVASSWVMAFTHCAHPGSQIS